MALVRLVCVAIARELAGFLWDIERGPGPRTLDLWGSSGKVDVIVPYTWLSGER